MSIKAMTWVWEHSEQKGAKLLMMLAIADRCDDFGECFPGHKRLAEKARIAKSSAAKSIKALEATGELSVIIHGGIKTTHGNTNRYYLKKYRDSLELETPEGNRSEYVTYDGVSKRIPQEVDKTIPYSSEDPSGYPSEKDSPSENDGGILICRVCRKAPEALGTGVCGKCNDWLQAGCPGYPQCSDDSDIPLPQCGSHSVDCIFWWDNNECSSVDAAEPIDEKCKHCNHKFRYDGKRSEGGIFECPECHKCVDYIKPIGSVGSEWQNEVPETVVAEVEDIPGSNAVVVDRNLSMVAAADALHGIKSSGPEQFEHIGALCEVVTETPKAKKKRKPKPKCSKCDKARKIVEEGMCWECNGYPDRAEMIQIIYYRLGWPGTKTMYKPANIKIMTTLAQWGATLKNFARYVDHMKLKYEKNDWSLTVGSLGKEEMFLTWFAEDKQLSYVDAPLYNEPVPLPPPGPKLTKEEAEELEASVYKHMTGKDYGDTDSL